MNGFEEGLSMLKGMIETVEGLRKMYTAATYGPPNIGFLWEGLFLPNGTMLKRMYRQGRHCIAIIKHGDLMLNDKVLSFQELCVALGDNEIVAAIIYKFECIT